MVSFRPAGRAAASYTLIRDVVLRIPPGMVASYGAVARMAGLPGAARLVGYALHSLPHGSGVPWHRVVGASGTISPHPDPEFGHVQRSLLEQEGVEFDACGRIDLDRFGWKGTAEREGD